MSYTDFSNLETIHFERQGAVGVVTLDRPSRLNAMNRRMLHEIAAVLSAADKDDEVRALVVTGAGRAFSTGFDLSEQVAARPQGVAAWEKVLREDFDVIMQFWRLAKPTVAAVRGYCLAGGFELALCCDLTVAASDAIFGEPELRFGASIVVMILPWLIGPKKAKELILTGQDRIGAEEAQRLGLINAVVPVGEELSAAVKVAQRMAAVDPMLMKTTKAAINRVYDVMGLRDSLETALEAALRIEAEGSPDKTEFLEIARRKGLAAAFAWRDERFS